MKRKINNLVGHTFGKWNVLSLAEKTKHGDTRWLCQCECGNERIVYGHSLKSGQSVSCGCVPRLVDLTGKVFGKLTVIGYSHTRTTPSSQGKPYWLCQCECGRKKVIQGCAMKNGSTVSCGCHKRDACKQMLFKHGHATRGPSLTYQCWRAMMMRCNDPSAHTFRFYGQRGISVCERWHTFANFLEDMGLRPSRKHSIDRYPDKNGNYCKENCRWATQKQQCRNTRRNHFLTLNEETHCVSEWAEILGVKPGLLHTRLRLGWPIEKVLMPKHTSKKR